MLQIKVELDCLAFIDTHRRCNAPHECGHCLWNLCQKHIIPQQQYFSRNTNLEREDKYVIINSDMEILLLPPDANEDRRDEVNLVCASPRCKECKEKDTGASWIVCGNPKNSISLSRPWLNLIEHVLDERDQFRRTVCLAHNAFRYNTYWRTAQQ